MARVIILTDIQRPQSMWGRSAGPIRIATELRQAGYSTQIIDFLMDFVISDFEVLLKIIASYIDSETLVIGISTTFMQQRYSKINGNAFGFISKFHLKAISDVAKSLNPKIKIVLGGSQVDHLRNKNIPYVDAMIIGYADHSFLEYLKYIEGKNPFFQFKTNTSNNALIIDHDPKAEKFEFTKSQLLWQPEDHVRQKEALPLEVGRGCIFKCSYCYFPLTGKTKLDHIKESDVLYEELMRNYELCGTTSYTFSDDTFNDSIEKMELLHKTFQRLPFKLKFVAYLRLDLIHAKPHTADLLLDIGLHSAHFGIETFNQKTGAAIGKGLHPNKVKDTLDMVKDKWGSNITTIGSFIMGLPYETRETLNDTIEYLSDKNKCPLDALVMFPLGLSPFTDKSFISKFQENYEKYGYHFDANQYWYNSEFHELEVTDLAEVVSNDWHRSGRIKFCCFDIPMMENLGYTFEQLSTLSKLSFPRSEINARRVQLFEEYKSKLLSAPK